MTDFKTIACALDERGFCVVPEFLSREEIDFLVEEFDASPDYSPQRKPSMRRSTLATSQLPVKPELCVLTQWDDEKPSKE